MERRDKSKIKPEDKAIMDDLLASYSSDHVSCLVPGSYTQFYIHEFFPKKFTNQLTGKRFLQYLKEENLKVKVIKREYHPWPGMNEHEEHLSIEGTIVLMRRSKYSVYDNFIGVNHNIPQPVLTRIGKAISKGLGNKWIKYMQEICEGTSYNNIVGTDPSKELELYNSFVEKVDSVKDIKELKRLVEQTEGVNKKIEIPAEEWEKMNPVNPDIIFNIRFVPI